MGSLRPRALALVLLLLLLVAVAQGGDQRKQQRAKREVPVEAKDSEGTAPSEGAVTADVVQTALHAWLKLRDGVSKHAARRRSTSELEAASAEAGAGEKAGAGAGADRVRVSEFSFTAESSFTALSRALDRLANRSRGGAPIAATEFVVEGSVDKDTIQSYLRSHAARGALARAEEDALRKVVGVLLKSPARDNANASASVDARGATAQPPRRLVARAAPPPSHAEPDPSPTDPLPSSRRRVGRPSGTFRGRFLWSLDDDGYDDDQPSEGLPRRLPPLYALPPADARVRGDDNDDEDADSDEPKARELNVDGNADDDDADDVNTDGNAEDDIGDDKIEDDEAKGAGNHSWKRRKFVVEEGDHVLEDDVRDFVKRDGKVKYSHFGVPTDDDDSGVFDEIGAKYIVGGKP